MASIIGKIDLNKIDNKRVVENKYKKQDGTEVTERFYEFEIVELNEDKKKVISSGDGWTLTKTHFLCDKKTKEEKANKVPTVYVGEGKQFTSPQDNQGAQESYNQDAGEAIPF